MTSWKTEPEMRRQRGSRTISKRFAVTKRVFGESHRMRAGCLFFKDVRSCFYADGKPEMHRVKYNSFRCNIMGWRD